MPSIPVHPLPPRAALDNTPASSSPLSSLLATPSGLALVEIQGTLNSTLPPTADNSIPIGRLQFPDYHPGQTDAQDTSWRKRVYLYVGAHQRLTGEVKALAKPVGVVRRRASEAGHEESEALEFVEVVRWKIVFAGRPEPVGGMGGGGGGAIAEAE